MHCRLVPEGSGDKLETHLTLFYVDADQGEVSFSFDASTFRGMSLWDLGMDPDNKIVFNDVRFCGQLISDSVNLQNVSGSGCEFGTPSEVPVPAAFWLFGTALIGFAGMSRSRSVS